MSEIENAIRAADAKVATLKTSIAKLAENREKALEFEREFKQFLIDFNATTKTKDDEYKQVLAS